MWPEEKNSMIAHVLGESELEELYDLGVCSLWGFLKVVRQLVVNLSFESHLFACYVNFVAASFVSL